MYNRDLEHLKLLSILHYVAGGILAFLSCFPIIYVTLGVVMLVKPPGAFGPPGQEPPPFVGGLLVVIGTSVILLGWSVALCLLLGGRFLARRRRHRFCLVAAGLSCLWLPFGTVLGIFTILVLVRPSVKRLFQEETEVEPEGEG